MNFEHHYRIIRTVPDLRAPKRDWHSNRKLISPRQRLWIVFRIDPSIGSFTYIARGFTRAEARRLAQEDRALSLATREMAA